MPEDPHPLKEAVIDLGIWLDTWRDQPGLESLVDSVRESWMDYVAGSGMFEIPRAEGMSRRSAVVMVSIAANGEMAAKYSALDSDGSWNVRIQHSPLEALRHKSA